jgi:hypothetical protein
MEFSSSEVIVQTYSADREWKPMRGQLKITSIDFSKVFDTTIQLFDSRSGSEVAKINVSQAMNAVGNSKDMVYATRTTEDGEIAIDIWRVTLKR